MVLPFFVFIIVIIIFIFFPIFFLKQTFSPPYTRHASALTSVREVMRSSDKHYAENISDHNLTDR